MKRETAPTSDSAHVYLGLAKRRERRKAQKAAKAKPSQAMTAGILSTNERQESKGTIILGITTV